MIVELAEIEDYEQTTIPNQCLITLLIKNIKNVFIL